MLLLVLIARQMRRNGRAIHRWAQLCRATWPRRVISRLSISWHEYLLLILLFGTLRLLWAFLSFLFLNGFSFVARLEISKCRVLCDWYWLKLLLCLCLCLLICRIKSHKTQLSATCLLTTDLTLLLQCHVYSILKSRVSSLHFSVGLFHRYVRLLLVYHISRN